MQRSGDKEQAKLQLQLHTALFAAFMVTAMIFLAEGFIKFIITRGIAFEETLLRFAMATAFFFLAYEAARGIKKYFYETHK